jgi:hypothetical protein
MGGRISSRGWCFIIKRGPIASKWRRLLEDMPTNVQPRHGKRIKEDVSLLVAMTLAVD